MPRHRQSAVARNRVKRRLRELSREALLTTLDAGAPVDLVLRAMPSAYDADFRALSADVSRIADRLGRTA